MAYERSWKSESRGRRNQHFFCFLALLFAARLSFFILASTETTLEPFVAPFGADVALRTPLLDFEATT